MKQIGTISKINTELSYGFITTDKNHEVFFSTETVFKDICFKKLSVDQLVYLVVTDTPRGLFAQELQLA